MIRLVSRETTEKLLTVAEASHLLNLKTSRIRSAIFKREIPYFIIGRLIRFARYDLFKWLNGLKENMEITTERPDHY